MTQHFLFVVLVACAVSTCALSLKNIEIPSGRSQHHFQRLQPIGSQNSRRLPTSTCSVSHTAALKPQGLVLTSSRSNAEQRTLRPLANWKPVENNKAINNLAFQQRSGTVLVTHKENNRGSSSIQRSKSNDRLATSVLTEFLGTTHIRYGPITAPDPNVDGIIVFCDDKYYGQQHGEQTTLNIFTSFPSRGRGGSWRLHGVGSIATSMC